jgi:hypothetical protein
MPEPGQANGGQGLPQGLVRPALGKGRQGVRRTAVPLCARATVSHRRAKVSRLAREPGGWWGAAGGGCGGVLAGAPVGDCPFPSWLPSAPPAPAPSPAPRLVTLEVTQAATASGSRPSRPHGRVAHRGPPTATFPAPASFTVTRTKRTQPSPYTHGRHDADKGQLGASIQFDLVPKAKAKASVPGRGRLCDQPVTQYYAIGRGLSDGRGVDRADHSQPDAVELLRRRHAEAHPVRLDSSGAGPSDLRHCYMCETRDSGKWYFWPPKGGHNPGQPPHHRVCAPCRSYLANGRLVKEQHRASRCGVEYECPDGECGPDGC